MNEEHCVAMSERSVQELAGEPAAIRLTGQVPEMGTEVLLAWDGLEFSVTYETHSIPAAIGAARRRYPDAVVLQSRRVLTIEQAVLKHRGESEAPPCRERAALADLGPRGLLPRLDGRAEQPVQQSPP